eukprot:3579848-Amphidinium_carterae.1
MKLQSRHCLVLRVPYLPIYSKRRVCPVQVQVQVQPTFNKPQKSKEQRLQTQQQPHGSPTYRVVPSPK